MNRPVVEMEWTTPMIIAAVACSIAAYVTVVVLLYRSSRWDEWGLSMMGPLLMWRTRKGKRLLRWLAGCPRLWKGFASAGVAAAFVMMVVMVVNLLLVAYVIFTEPVDPVPPESILALPGINPMLPLWYGLLGLIVAIFVHEISHGVLSVVGRLRVRSMGVLFCVIPVGAFVEPDQEDMEKAPRKVRRRVYAAGPMANVVAAFAFAGMFSWGMMASLEPVEDGVLILEVYEDSPAHESGMEPGMLIVTFGGVKTPDHGAFSGQLDRYLPGDNVSVSLLDGDREIDTYVILVDRYQFYLDQDLSDEDDIPDSYNGTAFLGIGSRGLEEFRDSVAFPVTSADSPGEAFVNVFTYGALLPMNTQIMPFHQPLTGYYEPGGLFTGADPAVFWTLANCLYYIFWINLLLGLFNALPMVPLDGGPIFRDTYAGWLERRKKGLSMEQVEEKAGRATVRLAIFIFALLAFVLVVPYL